MPSSPDRIKEIDALRGFAAISVVLFHYTMACPPLERYFVFGVTGVELFFMISGFVIFFTLQRTRTGMDFIVSRFSRLYPTYWVCLTLTLFFVLCQGVREGHFDPDLVYIYGINLSMWQQYFHVPNLEWTYWTLTVEWQFYAFMYLLFVTRKIQQIEIVGWAFLGLSICFGTFIPTNFPVLYKFLTTYLPLIQFFPLFFAGVLFYKLKFESPRSMIKWQLLACLASQFFLFKHAGTSSWHISAQNYAIALIGFFTAFTLLAYGYLSFIVNKVTVYLGAISYPLYLIHLYFGFSFFIPLLTTKYHIPYGVASLCIAFPLVLLFSSFLHEKIEVPSTRLIRQWYDQFKFSKISGGDPVKKWRYWIVGSLLPIMMAGFVTLWKIQKKSADAPSSFQPSSIQQKSKEYESNPVKKGSVVMVGTSLTEQFNLAKYFTGIENRGIRGDYSSHLLSRIGAISIQKPAKIFIEIGINDIGFLGYPPDTVLANCIKMLDKIETLSPSTSVYIQSVLPLSENPSFSPTLSHKNKEVVVLNEQLKKMCKSKEVVYIDLYTTFLHNGELNPSYTVDGIHLNEKGYKVWAGILFPYIQAN